MANERKTSSNALRELLETCPASSTNTSSKLMKCFCIAILRLSVSYDVYEVYRTRHAH